MAVATRRASPTANRLILDSGAVIGLARGDRRARVFLERALEADARVEVPVVVVAETVRNGPRDATVQRVLKAIDLIPETTEGHGRTAGRLLALARSASTLDALVVAQAIHGGGAQILTSDPYDLRLLAAPHPEVKILEL